MPYRASALTSVETRHFYANRHPCLVEKAATLFDDPAWTYEPKWDGFRVLATVRGGSVRLISRNGHSFTNLFWPVSDALRGFPASLLLDGEVIAINDEGRPDFEALQQRCVHETGSCRGTCVTWSLTFSS